VNIEGKSEAQIIKEASAKESIVWERPENPNKRNMSNQQVKVIVASFPDKSPIDHVFVIDWELRTSDKGTHAATCEKEVLVIDYWRKRFGQNRKYYFKGFLFHEKNIIGAEYQSAREVQK
jgi:hypothetical protein